MSILTVITWYQIQIVAVLAANFVLMRMLAAEAVTTALYEVPFFYTLYMAVTREPFRRVAKGVTDRMMLLRIGEVAHRWTIHITWLMFFLIPVLFSPAALTIANVTATTFFLVHLTLRMQFESEILEDRHKLGFYVAEISEHKAALVRHLLLLIVLPLVPPVHVLWACSIIYGVESVILVLVYRRYFRKQARQHARVLEPLSLGNYLRLLLGWKNYVFTSFKDAIFRRGERAVLMASSPPAELLWSHTVLSNIRTALRVVISKPLAGLLEHTYFFRSIPSSNRSLFTTRHFTVWWISSAVLILLAPWIAPWLLWYESVSSNKLTPDHPIHGAIVALVILFPFELLDEVLSAYARTRGTKRGESSQPTLWVDLLGTSIYIMLTVEMMHSLKLRGLVYVLYFPILWRAVFRGPIHASINTN